MRVCNDQKVEQEIMHEIRRLTGWTKEKVMRVELESRAPGGHQIQNRNTFSQIPQQMATPRDGQRPLLDRNQ